MQEILNQMEERNIDGLFLVNDSNIRYISGYTNTDSFILLTKSRQFFLTDYRYSEQAENECSGFEIITVNKDEKPLECVIADIFKGDGLTILGFEEKYLVVQLMDKLRNAMPQIEFLPAGDIFENTRFVKSEQEISHIQTAARIADKAFELILGFIEPGMTEAKVAWQLETFMRDLGAESSAFEILLPSGKRTSLPHGAPTQKKIETGDFITMDFGALVEGYRSDMTRTVVVGTPDEKQKKIYSIVQEAQQQGLKSARAGRVGKDVHQDVMNVIDGHGYLEFAGKGLGHGLGLDIHEIPFMNTICDDILKENNVVTIEPGIYIPFWGGVRIEDTVVIKNDSCITLTNAPKELISI